MTHELMFHTSFYSSPLPSSSQLNVGTSTTIIIKQDTRQQGEENSFILGSSVFPIDKTAT